MQNIWCAATRYVTDIRIIRSDPNARIYFTLLKSFIIATYTNVYPYVERPTPDESQVL